MNSVKAKVIVNPAASGGKTGRQWPMLKSMIAQAGMKFDFELTEYRNHAIEIARNSVEDGYRRIVCVGGDGTVNETVNGLVTDDYIPQDIVLSIIPLGAGADFAKTLGISRDPQLTVRSALGDKIITVDVGKIGCISDGKPIERYFVNIAGLGFDGENVALANRMRKRFGGTLHYLYTTLLTLFTYRNKDVQLTIDGQKQIGRYNSIIVCNGQYFGGGMRVGPNATVDDGFFDIIVLKDFRKFEVLLNIPRIYSGSHLELAKVDSIKAQEVQVSSKQRMLLQAEGELIGESPATFRIMPRMLKLSV